MSMELRQFEREIERQYAELRDSLPAPTSDAAFFDKLEARVGREAARHQNHRLRLITLRPLLGVAAALTLIVALNWPPHATVRDFTSADPESAVADWVLSLDDTETQFVSLFDPDWSYQNSDIDGADDDAGGFFDSLEESFESFESIIGA